MYTRIQFGQELKSKVERREDVTVIGHWTYSTYLKYINEIEDRVLDNILLTLNTMEDGPEFAFSYKILNKIAGDLIAGKDVDLNSDEYREPNL